MSDRGQWVVTLDKIMESVGKTEGFMVTDLHPGDILEIRTRDHSTYVFKIIEPQDGLAEVTSNGLHITQPTKVYIGGSLMSPFGRSIRVKWISPGYQLELGIKDRGQYLTLSETISISVNGLIIMPTADKTSH